MKTEQNEMRRILRGIDQKYATPAIQAVKPGSVIEFNDGFQRTRGIAYGLRRNARFGDSLRVKMPDCSFKFVESFTTIGIGVYYIGGKGAL